MAELLNDTPEQPESLTIEEAADRFLGGTGDGNQSEEGDEAEDADADVDNAAVEGEDEADDGDEEQSAEGEPTYTVKVDGEEFEVPASELVKGYQRTADYTRKAQALAEFRKHSESEVQAIRAERAQYAQLLGKLESKLQEAYPEPDWEKLKAEDPIEYAAQWATHQRIQSQRAVMRAEQERIQHLQRAEATVQLEGHVKQEFGKLVEAIPSWTDQTKREEERTALFKYGKSLGFTERELDEVYDHRAVVALYKAWKYDQLQKRRPQLQAAAAAAKPKPMPPGKPSARPGAEVKQARERLARSGTVTDAAALFERLI